MVTAKVVRVEVSSREVAADSPDHGSSGPYEVIKGMIYLEVDPENSANQLIVDLNLTDRNERGNVEFSTEFELHKPVDAGRGNRRLIYFVNNRGHKMGIGHFTEMAGRNWLYSEGWSYLWCGWNCDVKEDDRKLNIQVPVVTENGKTIEGEIYSEIISYADDLVYSLPLVRDNSIAYVPVSMDNAHATLTMQQYRWEEPVEVPNDHWSFARFENGLVVSDPGYVYIKEGFKPGWLYDLVYRGKDPKVTGLGLAAIRDVVSFFKYEKTDEYGFRNPLADVIDYAFAWGHSQSGRLLYHYIFQDFNGDEQRRNVLDGLIANCPGSGKGLFNSRFAQTTRHGSHHENNLYPVDTFPFTTVEQYDPNTEERGDACARARKSGFLPKMFFINTTTDYWTRAASLLHTDVEGMKDAEIDPEVRMYFIAGRTHVDARIGIIGRALLTALDHWVSYGIEPPESRIPRISDGTLVSLEAYLSTLPDIPGLQTPESFYNPYRLDLGPRWQTEGIADYVPPKVGPRYVCLVPQVNDDGNELAGIHLPEIAVPLATFLGWHMRSPSFSNTLRINRGRTLSFPRTRDEREKNDDPRKSISELYPTKEDYLFKVTESLLELNQQRFLLDEDVAVLLEQAVKQATFVDDLRLEDLPFVTEVVEKLGAEAGFEYFKRLEDGDMLWWFGLSAGQFMNEINSEGYELLAAGQLESALELFKLNTMVVPGYWNTWDSLAECYYHMKQYDLSMQYYEKSLELNPDNTNAVQMLEKMRAQNPAKN
ncbi:MAG: tetratricopeptide repeat protein [Gemmatimonadota bacterium]|nr:MAG: tetratricopeptide repeat protein [Gemmatimonadota bacterium]